LKKFILKSSAKNEAEYFKKDPPWRGESSETTKEKDRNAGDSEERGNIQAMKGSC